MITPIRNIVVGVATVTDASTAAAARDEDPVLAPAVELARRLGATLHVVHVYEMPYALVTPYAAYVPFVDTDFRERYCQDVLARLERETARFGYDGIRCHAIEGSPGRTLVELAVREKAELMVVGATRRGRLWRNLLGTTADRVIRGSHVPVLVLHQPFTVPVKRVLLTTDLSPESAVLHDRGADTAAALFGIALEMRTVMVVWFDTLLPPPLKEETLRDAADNELREFVAARPRKASRGRRSCRRRCASARSRGRWCARRRSGARG